MHCQRILFGGSADNGYARLLGPFTEDDEIRSRITLLEGPPFARELAEIKDRYRTVSFDKVFRSQMLVGQRRPLASIPTPPRTPSTGYASIVAQASAASVSTKSSNSVVMNQATTTAVLLDRVDERVDPPLHYNPKDFVALRSRRLCNTFYLLGKCPYLEKYGDCQHDHSAKLSSKQTVALRAVARLTLCKKGRSCKDPECLSGHR
jgi:hypothetical protein